MKLIYLKAHKTVTQAEVIKTIGTVHFREEMSKGRHYRAVENNE